jgi:hypothetical protein
MKNKMKLFVWHDFCPDYTSGLAIAIARTEKQAKKQIAKANGYLPDDDRFGVVKVYPIGKPIAFCVHGGG